jgi:hypothetical protein
MSYLKQHLEQDLIEAHECFYNVNKNLEKYIVGSQYSYEFKRNLEKLDNFFVYWNYHVKNLKN